MRNWSCTYRNVGLKLATPNQVVIIPSFAWNSSPEITLAVINAVCGVCIGEGWTVKVTVFAGKEVCWGEGTTFCEVTTCEMAAAVTLATCCVKSCGVETTLLDTAWDFTSPESKFDVTKFCWGCCVVAIRRSRDQMEQNGFCICIDIRVNTTWSKTFVCRFRQHIHLALTQQRANAPLNPSHRQNLSQHKPETSFKQHQPVLKLQSTRWHWYKTQFLLIAMTKKSLAEHAKNAGETNKIEGGYQCGKTATNSQQNSAISTSSTTIPVVV